MKTNEIYMRMATPEDAQEILDIYTPYVLSTPITFEYTVPDLEEFRERITGTLKKFPYIVAVQDGIILGYAYASTFKSRAAYDWAVETSIYVRQDTRSRGVGHMLYGKLEEILKKQNIINVNACITYPNPGSISFHEKLGYKTVAHFTKCGYKLGQWYDMIWMEKMLGEHEAEPAAIIPVTNLADIDFTHEI